VIWLWGSIRLSRHDATQLNTSLMMVNMTWPDAAQGGTRRDQGANSVAPYLKQTVQLWIKFNSGLFIGWYCQWQARVVGCCVHIASVIWYLSYYRHQEEIGLGSNPSSTFTSHIEDTCAVDCWPASESECDSE